LGGSCGRSACRSRGSATLGRARTRAARTDRQGGESDSAASRRDVSQFSQRVRGTDESRRICAVDRLAESRLPRTTCRTAQEWRERQLHDLRKE